MIRIILLYVVCTIAIAVPPALINYYPGFFELVPQFWFMYAFFAVLTLVLIPAIAFGQNMGDQTGAQVFLIFTAIKLLACMIFALFYLRSYHVNSIRFVVCFFYLYLLNTAFEIYALISNLRHQTKT